MTALLVPLGSAAAHAHGDGSLRHVARPIAVYSYDASGQPQFEVYVRLNRAVPRRSGGSLLGTVRLAGFGADEPPTRSSNGFFSIRTAKGRHCYGQTFAVFPGSQRPSALDRPRRGQLVRVDVLVAGTRTSATRYTRLQPRRGVEQGAVRYSRRLGCIGT